MTAVESVRITNSSRVRGTALSVILAVPEESRNELVKLIQDGLTTQEALDVLAKQVAIPAQRVTLRQEDDANPFRSNQ